MRKVGNYRTRTVMSHKREHFLGAWPSVWQGTPAPAEAALVGFRAFAYKDFSYKWSALNGSRVEN